MPKSVARLGMYRRTAVATGRSGNTDLRQVSGVVGGVTGSLSALMKPAASAPDAATSTGAPTGAASKPYDASEETDAVPARTLLLAFSPAATPPALAEAWRRPTTVGCTPRVLIS